MIVLTTTAAQTVAPGQPIIFDRQPLLHSGCGECFNQQVPSSVKLRGTGIYTLAFHGNIGSVAAGTAQLAIQLGGTNVILPETQMISQTAAAGDLNNVAMETGYKNCCGDFDRISVVNTGTADITVGAGATLYTKRES